MNPLRRLGEFDALIAGSALLVMLLVPLLEIVLRPLFGSGIDNAPVLVQHCGLLLAIPLSGWLMSSAKGFQTVWFGVLPIPDLLDKNKELGDLLQTVHMSLNLLFVVVLLGHIGAALKHHFIDKDDILIRILPRHSKEN